MRLTRLGLSLRITLIALMVAGLAVVWWVEDEESRLRQDFLSERSSTLEMALELGAVNFNQSVEQLRRDTLFLAGIPHASGLMRASLNHGKDRADQVTQEVWLRRLQDLFNAFLRTHPEYTAARYIGVADYGRELVAAVRRGSAVEVLSPDTLQPYADRDFFRAGLTLAVGRVHLAPFAPDQANRLVLRAVTPVFDISGNVYGLMLLERDASSLFGVVSQGLPPSVQSVIADPQGNYLYRSDAAQAVAASGNGAGVLQDIPMLAVLLGDTAVRRLPVQEANREQGNGYLMAQRVYYDSGDPSRYMVLAQWWPTEGWSGLSKPGAFGLLTLALLIGASIMSLLYFAFRPLRRMTILVRRIAAGETDLRLHEKGGEVGKLAAAINLLLERYTRHQHQESSAATMRKSIEEVSGEGGTQNQSSPNEPS